MPIYLGRALAPLSRQLTPANVVDFFTDLGVVFLSSLATQTDFNNALAGAQSSASDLINLLQQLETDIGASDDAAILADGVAVIEKIAELLKKLDALGNELVLLANSLPGIAPADVTAFAAGLSEKILNMMAVEYIESAACYIVDVAALAGLIDRHSDPGVTGDSAKPPYVSSTIRRFSSTERRRLFTCISVSGVSSVSGSSLPFGQNKCGRG